ncbi:hypothetical protein [Streptomyces sp. SID3343]|uniref:hypothetical protein n=1 Tax=Streptomyces sp. SID3343 TaxID=2690260 RepID=UPI001367AB5F|nr:hypothetical protein [Streptomyces sp. SID3343]MYW04222.1 hypothetical protein [Streptomyces sp. SID3343]
MSIQIQLDGEQIDVTGFERTLPPHSAVRDRTRLVSAGTGNPYTALTDDAWHSIARAVVSPRTVGTILSDHSESASSLIDEHVGGAVLRSVHARVWLTELFPGLQPRTGQEALPVADPEVHGDVDADGLPRAVLAYRYRDMGHLEAHLRQTIAYTRRANRDPYDASILARRVTRPVIAHPCRLEFADGTEAVHVLVVRDGITRLTSAWALLSRDGTPEGIARTATDAMLAEKPTRRGSEEKPLSQRMALGRQDVLAELHGEFMRGVGEDPPSGRAVRIGQACVFPAQITVGVQAYEESSLPRAEVFDDAVRSVLASVHVEFKAWDSAAQNVEVGARALMRLVRSEAADRLTEDAEAVYELALGRLPLDALPKVFGNRDIPETELWRAVYLTHFLTRPTVFDAVKRYAKQIKGTRRMTTAGYAEILGPIIDRSWRAGKKNTLRQARNAWANGGVLTDEVRQADWAPIPCSNFTSLVEPALRGNKNARLTLAVAGGIALMADKLLSRNVGSAVPEIVPFRADVNLTVTKLSEPTNEKGLWLLAHAADRFDATRGAVNSFTDSQVEKSGGSGEQFYTHVKVDLTSHDKILRDEAGSPVPLTQHEVVTVSDPVRAAEEGSEERPPEHSPIADRLAWARQRLGLLLADAETTLNQLLAMAGTPEAGTLYAFGSVDEWKKLHGPSANIQSSLWNNQLQDEEPLSEQDEYEYEYEDDA